MFAFLTYLFPPIFAPVVLLFRRKDYFSLYHACQALALLAGVAAVFILWLVIGWLIAFVSVTIPQIYMVPIVLALIMPIWGMFKRSRIYQGRGIWWSILGTLAIAIVFGTFSWWVITKLSPDVLPLTGPLLLMASFAIVMAAIFVGIVGILMGMVRSLRRVAKPVPVFGAWGDRWFRATTRRARANLAESDAEVLAAMHLSDPDGPPIGDAEQNASLPDTPIVGESVVPPAGLSSENMYPENNPLESTSAAGPLAADG